MHAVQQQSRQALRDYVNHGNATKHNLLSGSWGLSMHLIQDTLVINSQILREAFFFTAAHIAKHDVVSPIILD